MTEKIQALEKMAEDFYPPTDPGHDWLHIQRVKKSCMDLAEQEGADRDVVVAAALLHDVVNVPKNSPDRNRASLLAAERASEILESLDFDSEFIDKVFTAIVEHSYSAGLTPSTLEASILQDADRLDALGAIGIMRTVSCGAHMGSSYYHAKEPLAKTRNRDDYKYTIDHFFEKLFLLPDKMNTESARRMAEKRSRYMHDFLNQLMTEIEIVD